MKIKEILIAITFYAFQLSALAQQPLESPKDIQIGKPLPELVLKNLENFDKKRVSTNELKGKPFVLKFFGITCSSSIKHLYLTNQLAQEYKEDVHFFVIAGHNGQYVNNETMETEMQRLRELYERARSLYEFKLPVTFDIKLFQSVPRIGLPHFILVDNEGIVQAVTNTLSSGIISDFLKGEKLIVEDFSSTGIIENTKESIAFRKNHSALIQADRVNQNLPILSSIIMPYTNEMPRLQTLTRRLNIVDSSKVVEGFGSIADLYNLAYHGEKYYDIMKMLEWERYPFIVLETKDSMLFKEFQYEKPRKNMFWYSVISPENEMNELSLRNKLKHDLEDYFGYQASIEKRRVPYWKITLPKSSLLNLKSKGGKEVFDSDYYTTVSATNFPVDQFLNKIIYLHRFRGYQGLPFRNQVKANIKIDVPLNYVDFFDFPAVKNVLVELGFKIEKAYGEYDALVLRDRTSVNLKNE